MYRVISFYPLYRNLTETHLGQIHTVCPNLFSFRQEKLRHVPGQSDRYELVVAPVLDSTIGEYFIKNTLCSIVKIRWYKIQNLKYICC